MDYIYLPCVQRVKDSEQLFTTNGVNPIAHFDLFKGQYLNPEIHQPWAKPALFFKFNITWEDLSNNTQKGIGELELHIEQENYSESYDGSSDRDQALSDFELVRIVSAVLHGFKTANFTALKRRATNMDDNPSNTNVTVVRFSFELIDESMDKYRDWLREKLDGLHLTKKPMDLIPPAPDDDDKYHL
jgi:hypothetical protein